LLILGPPRFLFLFCWIVGELAFSPCFFFPFPNNPDPTANGGCPFFFLFWEGGLQAPPPPPAEFSPPRVGGATALHRTVRNFVRSLFPPEGFLAGLVGPFLAGDGSLPKTVWPSLAFSPITTLKGFFCFGFAFTLLLAQNNFFPLKSVVGFWALGVEEPLWRGSTFFVMRAAFPLPFSPLGLIPFETPLLGPSHPPKNGGPASVPARCAPLFQRKERFPHARGAFGTAPKNPLLPPRFPPGPPFAYLF